MLVRSGSPEVPTPYSAWELWMGFSCNGFVQSDLSVASFMFVKHTGRLFSVEASLADIPGSWCSKQGVGLCFMCTHHFFPESKQCLIAPILKALMLQKEHCLIANSRVTWGQILKSLFSPYSSKTRIEFSDSNGNLSSSNRSIRFSFTLSPLYTARILLVTP